MTLPLLLQPLSGKAAVFVRGFIDHVADQPGYTAKLRKAQDAGVLAVTELGETISIPYVSKLTKLLEAADVIDKSRKGKGYEVAKADKFLETLRHLNDEAWGMTIEREDSPEVISLRSKFLDHMSREGIVRITPDAPLPKAAYQVAIDKFKSGQYDMVFVEKKYDLDLLDYGDEYVDRDSLNSDHTFTASVGD
jgi:hypothetical protein